jgi:ABC-2 type transport system ATP-binding protein
MSEVVATTEPEPATAPVDEPAASDPDRPEPVIRTRRLTKKYGELTAVNKLDLAVYPGEIFGLLGQNGAGKTTTILMLLGLSEPTSGEASVMGLDPAWEPREVKRRVGYLPDAVGFYEDMTGRENLRYTARLNGLRRDEAEAAITEVLEQVGLTDRANDPVEQYSRGMRQRLGIADALVKSPDLLILDEPTTSIDPLGVVEILDLLRKLVDEGGLAIMLSSHLLSQVQSVCDRIGIFAAGRMIGVGTVDELARQFGDGTAVIEVGLELPTQADVDRAAAALRAINAVESVEPAGPGNGTWRVHVRPSTAEGRVRQDILVAAVDQGLRLTAIRPIVPSLDEIYRTAIERPIPKRTGVKRRGTGRPAGAKRTEGEKKPDGEARPE